VKSHQALPLFSLQTAMSVGNELQIQAYGDASAFTVIAYHHLNNVQNQYAYSTIVFHG
jgi:hypothetical protein